MVMFHSEERTVEDVMALKQEIKNELVRRAVEQGGGSADQYVIRETVAGDKDGSPADFVDLDIVTPVASNCQYWGLDETDQGTAGDLTAWLTSQTVDDNTWMSFFGFFDNAPRSRAPITDVFINSPMNDLSRLSFTRGGGTTGVWEVEQVYCYNSSGVTGFNDEPVFFDQNQTPQIKTCTNYEGTAVDKPFGLRNYLVERRGTINPVDHMGKSVGGSLGGIEPVQELSRAKVEAIKTMVRSNLVAMAVKDRVISSEEEAIIMEPLVGGEAATDDTDMYFEDTYVAGHQMYAVDDDELTADTLSNVIDTSANYKKLADNVYMGIYGVADNSAFPTMNALRFKISDSVLDFWHVQHGYAYPQMNMMTDRPLYFSQNDPLKIEINCRVKSDYFPVIKALFLISKDNRLGGA